MAAGWLLLGHGVHADDIEVIEDITSDTTWTSSNQYLIGGPIWVRNNATLTIEPGTTIYGYERDGAVTPGALIVTRGSKIMAEGTRDQPIIFTALAERDGLDDDGDPETPNIPLTLEDSGLWGGLVILGNAVLNKPNDDGKDFGEFKVEGFPTETASDLVSYGGNNDDDNSGVLRYVSIRYGGRELTTDNEINGLTLGAVGRGTTIEYIEVFNNSDDGVEFFGGTVDTKYMAMAFNEDESFDIDQGYRGRGQFWFAIQKDVGAGSNFAGEHDGGDGDDKSLEPFARVKVYNATFIGGGSKTAQENGGFRLKDNFAGQYHNSIFTGFRDYAVRIDDDLTRTRANSSGDLAFENNLWYDIGTYDGTAASLTKNSGAEEIAQVSANGNQYANPFLGGTSRRGFGGLDPRPAADGPAYHSAQSAYPDGDPFYEPVNHKGAFNTHDNWLEGWTRLSELGYFKKPVEGGQEVTVEGDITTDTVWTSDKTYLLGGPVWVREGATLTIEAGTKIYGFEADGAVTPGALIITRGSKIYAEGTREDPIVFSALAERDGIDDDGDPGTPNIPVTLEDSGLWGGVIILGNSVLNKPNDDGKDFGEFKVEGFPTETASNLVSYGGKDDNDDSGILRYVSIRYGGRELTTDNEINGLTLGAVGSGTTIEFIEVFNNSDDGVEFFGSTVDTRYMVMAFNEDESFDIDQGFRGRGQFWFAVQKDVGAGSNFGGEHDGGDGDDKSLEPLAEPKIYNATYIGGGADNAQENGAFRLKDNFAGQYHNSVFTGFRDYAIRVDDDLTKGQINDGRLRFDNNTFFDFGSFEEGNFASLTKNGSAEELLLLSEARGNRFEDPKLSSISRTNNVSLSPLPAPDSPLFTEALSDFPEGSEGFYQATDFRGAFGEVNWAAGWTHLSQAGFLGQDVDVVEDIVEDTTWTNDRNYLLGGPVWVREGATLTIEPGTTIYGYEREGAVTPGALIVTRGSQIIADGTRDQPIVFTARAERDGIDDDGDPLTPNVPVTLEDSGLWGGLILLGNARLNKPNDDGKDFGEFKVEGFPTETAGDLVSYGGVNDEDNSGILRYVSIRYGGRELTTDNEINGLTLGAVGSGTTIEHIEVFNNSDDGVEFFGGTVDTKWMIMAFNEDEAFDIDQGYRGRGQFWFAIQKDVGAGSNFAGEHDGGDGDDKSLEPFARTLVYNATFIGGGADDAQENGAFRLKDNFAGQYHNSIFTDFRDYAMRIDDDLTKARANTAGDLSFENNLWYDIGTYDGTPESLTKNGNAEEIANTSGKGNAYANPFLGGTSRKGNGGLDPRPLEGGPAYTSSRSAVPNDGFFSQVNYKGAFSSDTNWMTGWSRLSELGYFDTPQDVREDFVVEGDITEDTVWSNDRNYLLGGPIWVRDGATLTIEAGTTVYGFEADGAVTPGALIVTRDSKIYAEGTRENPIIFTALAERDGIDDDGDPATPNFAVTLEDSGLWGGLILLGNSVLNKPNDDGKDFGEFKVEGFPTETAGDLVSYGGTNDEDSSGILRYVSIRYGGRELTTDNEINGLTLGAVGSGTTIEYVEVFNNSDDGVEFFGSTVDTRYMVMAFNEDESFDIDQGFRGRGQYWFAVQKDVGAGSNFGGEHDGGDGDDKSLEPLAEPKIYNATFIGGGPDDAQENGTFRLKDNFAGQYHNSVFTGFRDYAVRVDDDLTKGQVNAGRLRLENNTWFDIGTFDGSLESLTKNSSTEELLLVSPDRGNVYEDPLLRGISRQADGGLDPRPANASPLLGATASPFPAGSTGFYQPDTTRGAFGSVNWADGWTRLSSAGFFGNLPGGDGGVDPGVDTDGDGTPDSVEIATGTDPNNPADFFKILAVTADNNITWPSAAGATYDVQYSTDLQTWVDVATVAGDAGQTSYQDDDAGRLGNAAGYYRVVLK